MGKSTAGWDLPCLIFDTDGALLSFRLLEPSDTLEHEFYASLRSGDRKYMWNFCAVPFDSETSYVKILPLHGFRDFRYVFLEKNLTEGETVNLAYPGMSVADFHSLMSARSEQYRKATGFFLDEYLRLTAESAMPENREYVSPNAFRAIHLPELLARDFQDFKLGARYCDLYVLSESLAAAIRTHPSFSQTDLILRLEERSDLEETDVSSGIRQSMHIFEFPVNFFTHLFSSVVFLFDSLSDTHRIEINVSCFANGGFVTVKTHTARCFPALSDSSCLTELLLSSESLYPYASVTDLIASAADIRMSVRTTEEQQMETTITLGNQYQSKPVFRYSDPLEYLDAVLYQSKSFLDAFLSA